MAFICNGASAGTGTLGQLHVSAYYDGAVDLGSGYKVRAQFEWGYGGTLTSTTPNQGFTQISAIFDDFIAVGVDRNGIQRGKAEDTNAGVTAYGETFLFQSQADPPSIGTPTTVDGSISVMGAQVQCLITGKTVESTAASKVMYKRSVDSIYTETASTSVNGYDSRNVNEILTSLLPATTYQYFFRVSRTANGGDVSDSSVQTFTTLPVGTVTTRPASDLGQTSAQLNAVVNPNGYATSYYFQYGKDTSYGSSTAAQGPSTGSLDIVYYTRVTGLKSGFTYHFRAVGNTSGVLAYGSDATFTTPTSDLPGMSL